MEADISNTPCWYKAETSRVYPDALMAWYQLEQRQLCHPVHLVLAFGVYLPTRFFRRLKYFCYRKCLNLVVIWALQKLVDILYCFVFKRDLKKVKEELNWRVFFYAWRPFHEFIYPFMHHCNFFWFKTLSHCNFIFQLNEQINRIHYWLKTVNLSLNRSDIRWCSLRTLENKCKGYHK